MRRPTEQQLLDYLDKATPPDDFVVALLCNDLFGAFYHCPSEAHIGPALRLMMERIPEGYRGTYERYMRRYEHQARDERLKKYGNQTNPS